MENPIGSVVMKSTDKKNLVLYIIGGLDGLKVRECEVGESRENSLKPAQNIYIAFLKSTSYSNPFKISFA